MDLFEGRAKVIFAVILVAILALLRDDAPRSAGEGAVVVGKERANKNSANPVPGRPAANSG